MQRSQTRTKTHHPLTPSPSRTTKALPTSVDQKTSPFAVAVSPIPLIPKIPPNPRSDKSPSQIPVQTKSPSPRPSPGHLTQTGLNLLRKEKSAKVGIAAKRKRAGWKTDYLLKVHSQQDSIALPPSLFRAAPWGRILHQIRQALNSLSAESVMPQPQECQTLAEVRSEIDRLDRSLIATISRRQQYVHAAARFKRDAAHVHAHERQRRMIAARRDWADAAGVDPDFVERLFTAVVDHFIQAELAVFAEKNQPEPGGKSISPTSAAGASGRQEEDGS